jgi:hypothetical protein
MFVLGDCSGLKSKQEVVDRLAEIVGEVVNKQKEPDKLEVNGILEEVAQIQVEVAERQVEVAERQVEIADRLVETLVEEVVSKQMGLERVEAVVDLLQK